MNRTEYYIAHWGCLISAFVSKTSEVQIGFILLSFVSIILWHRGIKNGKK